MIGVNIDSFGGYAIDTIGKNGMSSASVTVLICFGQSQ